MGNLNDPVYTHGDALICAQLSNAVYGSNAMEIRRKVGAALAPSKPITFRTHTPHQSLMILVENDDAVFCVVRGTRPTHLRSIIANAKFRLIRIRPGLNSRTHRGFLGSAAYHLRTARARLTQAQSAGKSVWLTGHSQGAAVAFIMAFIWGQSPQSSFNGLYSYGQPRAGSKALVRFMDTKSSDRLFRFVRWGDPVPAVPPLLFGYRHNPKMFLFDTQGTLRYRANSVLYSGIGLRNPLASHGCQQYEDSVRLNPIAVV